MFSHSEGETDESHEQENDEKRQEDRIVDQKAEPNCRQDRQQRGKSETAERRKDRASNANFVRVFFPEAVVCCFFHTHSSDRSSRGKPQQRSCSRANSATSKPHD